MTAIPPDLIETQIEIISRKEALALGLKRYFTGEPCLQGHVSSRQVIDAKCSACVSQRALNRRKRDRGKYALRNREWRARNREKLKVSEAARREANREKFRDRSRVWVRRWTESNPVQAKQKNKAKAQAIKQKYRSDPDVRRRVLRTNQKCRNNGPKNPKDEMQWLRKNRAQLRSVKRYLRNRPREQSESSQPET